MFLMLWCRAGKFIGRRAHARIMLKYVVDCDIICTEAGNQAEVAALTVLLVRG